MCSFIIWHSISETRELFPCEMRQEVLLKFCYISTKPHDITSQKAVSLETETLFNESLLSIIPILYRIISVHMGLFSSVTLINGVYLCVVSVSWQVCTARVSSREM